MFPEKKTSKKAVDEPVLARVRLFDIGLSALGLLILSPLLLFVIVLSICFQPGSPLYMQPRVGRGTKTFTLIKFRTMRPETRSVGTHEVNPNQVTAWGKILRKSKIDELPQLWNVLKGDMSLVGPRPCLPDQSVLISRRLELNVFNVRPGITGLAQIRGIDMSNAEFLAQTDAGMIRSMSVFGYFKYIFLTVCGWGRGDRIRLG